MSLYNMLFGVNQASPILLKILGISPGDIPRFRDCFIDGENIVIHTRTGGGNRDFYDCSNDENPDGPWSETIRNNPHFLHDEDEEFDCTYANFYYKFPEEYAEDLKAISVKNETYTPSEKWKMLFESLEKKP